LSGVALGQKIVFGLLLADAGALGSSLPAAQGDLKVVERDCMATSMIAAPVQAK
jgi:hypothetical protein